MRLKGIFSIQNRIRFYFFNLLYPGHLPDISRLAFLFFPGFSYQQVAVCQRHPTLQTDGGEVRIWQPVAPLTTGTKNRERGGSEAEDIC